LSVVAGLEVAFCFDEMIAGLGDDVGRESRIAGVNAELVRGVEGRVRSTPSG